MSENKPAGMGDFWSSVRELEKFWAWIVAAAALPFLAGLVQIAPPWPPAIEILTSIINLIAIVLAYQVARGASRRGISRALIVFALLFFVVLILYLGLYSQMTVFAQEIGFRFIKGFVCLPGTIELYGAERCLDLGVAELKLAEWTPEALWTSWSITLARLTIVVSWLLSFLFLSLLLVTFIVYQRGRRP